MELNRRCGIWPADTKERELQDNIYLKGARNVCAHLCCAIAGVRININHMIFQQEWAGIEGQRLRCYASHAIRLCDRANGARTAVHTYIYTYSDQIASLQLVSSGTSTPGCHRCNSCIIAMDIDIMITSLYICALSKSPYNIDDHVEVPASPK